MNEDWLIKAQRERNEARREREIIADGAPGLWQNACRAIDEVVKRYESMNESLLVEFTGCAGHTIRIKLFERHKAERGAERETIAINFKQNDSVIEMSSSLGAVARFPIKVDEGDQACLTYNDEEISVERFTEVTLRDALFPRP